MSWYGVTDLIGLVATTHDFEAHYTDRLIGPLPGAEALYEERSPVTRAAAMAGSVLLLQGTEDAVVPPPAGRAHARRPGRGRAPCDLRFFEGEGHGFRRADTLTACLEAELAFYLRSSASRISQRVLVPASPPVRGFRRHADHSRLPYDVRCPGAGAAVRAGVPRRVMRASRPRRATPCCTSAAPCSRLLTIYTSTNALYQVWGRMALSPFVFGARGLGRRWPVLVRRARRRNGDGRALTDAPAPAGLGGPIVIAGVRLRRARWPSRMGLEILWRFDGAPGSHLQPEVTSVEVGGQDLVKGRTRTSRSTACTTRCRTTRRASPTTPGFLPYLPRHGGAGHPERHLAQQRAERRPHLLLPDHAGGGRGGPVPVPGRPAAARYEPSRPSSSCPLAALPLATGGDDIPVVAFMLLAMVLAQRRRPFASGVVLGIASAMKFTAWPLAVLALFCRLGPHGRRRPLVMLAGILVVAVPDHLPLRPARALRPDRRRRALPARA